MLYLDDSHLALLDTLMEKTGKTRQDLIRQAIDSLLIRRRLLKPPKR